MWVPLSSRPSFLEFLGVHGPGKAIRVFVWVVDCAHTAWSMLLFWEQLAMGVMGL